MEIRTLQPDNTAYIRFSEGRNLFIQDHWLSLFDSGMHLYGVFKGEVVLAIFHAFEYKRYGKRFMIAAPFAPQCGLEMAVTNENLYKRQSETKRILRAIAEFFANEARNTFVEMALPPAVKDVQPFAWAGLNTTVRYTYRLALGTEENELLAAMSPERRKNIRDASKVGYDVSVNAMPKEVSALVMETLEAGGVGFDKPLVHRIIQDGKPWLFWITVSKEGVLKASTVVGTDANNAWYLLGGHRGGDGDALAGVWSMWHAIIESQKRGLNTFDFLGSSIPRIEQFFRGFGGELIPSFSISGGKGIFGAIKDLKDRINR